MSTSVFPDVNVWLALAHRVHPHHEQAIRWGESLDPKTHFYFCRFTQLGLLRLLTNGSVMRTDIATQAEAWRIHDLFYLEGMTSLAEEPIGLEQALRRLTSQPISSSKEWADSYLAAFAVITGFRLVTFDRALSRRTPAAILIETA